ncbi:MAG: 50S ribosomal protein L32 [Candidatus Kerfeldbacteria bacterium]|nr:50S ribosomal protein L32 [Candidatus Kerfeldbacteria bacterium]
MVQAKRRTKQQKRERRSHHAMKVQTLSHSTKSGKPHLPHHVNPFDGFYRGRDVLQLDAKASRKEKRAKKKEDRAKNK